LVGRRFVHGVLEGPLWIVVWVWGQVLSLLFVVAECFSCCFLFFVFCSSGGIFFLFFLITKGQPRLRHVFTTFLLPLPFPHVHLNVLDPSLAQKRKTWKANKERQRRWKGKKMFLIECRMKEDDNGKDER
jgi:hypothetical protein